MVKLVKNVNLGLEVMEDLKRLASENKLSGLERIK